MADEENPGVEAAPPHTPKPPAQPSRFGSSPRVVRSDASGRPLTMISEVLEMHVGLGGSPVGSPVDVAGESAGGVQVPNINGIVTEHFGIRRKVAATLTLLHSDKSPREPIAGKASNNTDIDPSVDTRLGIVNDEFLELLGYDPEDRDHVESLFNSQMTHPDDVQWNRNITRYIAKYSLDTLDGFVVTFRKKDNRTSIILRFTSHVFKDAAHGEVLLAKVEDVTDEYKMQRKIYDNFAAQLAKASSTYQKRTRGEFKRQAALASSQFDMMQTFKGAAVQQIGAQADAAAVDNARSGGEASKLAKVKRELLFAELSFQDYLATMPAHLSMAYADSVRFPNPRLRFKECRVQPVKLKGLCEQVYRVAYSNPLLRDKAHAIQLDIRKDVILNTKSEMLETFLFHLITSLLEAHEEPWQLKLSIAKGRDGIALSCEEKNPTSKVKAGGGKAKLIPKSPFEKLKDQDKHLLTTFSSALGGCCEFERNLLKIKLPRLEEVTPALTFSSKNIHTIFVEPEHGGSSCYFTIPSDAAPKEAHRFNASDNYFADKLIAIEEMLTAFEQSVLQADTQIPVFVFDLRTGDKCLELLAQAFKNPTILTDDDFWREIYLPYNSLIELAPLREMLLRHISLFERCTDIPIIGLRNTIFSGEKAYFDKVVIKDVSARTVKIKERGLGSSLNSHVEELAEVYFTCKQSARARAEGKEVLLVPERRVRSVSPGVRRLAQQSQASAVGVMSPRDRARVRRLGAGTLGEAPAQGWEPQSSYDAPLSGRERSPTRLPKIHHRRGSSLTPTSKRG